MYSTVTLVSFQTDNSVLINGILPLPPCCCIQQGGSSRIACFDEMLYFEEAVTQRLAVTYRKKTNDRNVGFGSSHDAPYILRTSQ